MAKTRRAARAPARAALPQSPARPLRASLSRKSKPTMSLNVDDSTDDDFGTDDHDSDVQSTRDTSADEGDGSDGGVGPAHNPSFKIRRSSRKRKRATAPTHKTAVTTKRSSRASRKRRKATTAGSTVAKQRRLPKLQSQSKAKLDSNNQIPVGVIPDWLDAKIPYRAWVDIFLYASDNGSSTGWLLHASTVCKAFFEPAMAALYQSPTLHTLNKAKKLVALLHASTENTLVDYRSKVKSLFINIQSFPLGLVHDTVRPLHRMDELIVFTPLDQPPYRDLDRRIRWHYPMELFTALDPKIAASADEGPGAQQSDASPILLKRWEWNSRLLGSYVANVADIPRIHQLPSFQGITKLSFINFQLPSLHKTVKDTDSDGLEELYQEDAQAIDSIADSINQLKGLSYLKFESSQIVNDRLLPQLPKDLSRLDLINCWEINSDDFAAFLKTHGRSLTTLNLMHNQSLDMGFLTELAVACPRLRELRMNLQYYKHHEYVLDNNPMYDHTLLPHQVPTWPPTLHLVEFEWVRCISVDVAEMFLQSFVDSAPYLPDLRHLTITYTMSIPWQDRADLRKKWYAKMPQVFARPMMAPRRHTTLRACLPATDPHPGTPSSIPKPERPDNPTDGDPSPPSRRSGRIAARASDSDRTTTSRIHSNGRPLYRDPDTDEDEDEEEDEFTDDNVSSDPGDGDSKLEAPEFVHGLCETLHIVFANQKVTEIQYGMEDFCDDQTSEEEVSEWDGQNDVDAQDETVFVWR